MLFKHCISTCDDSELVG